MAHIHAFIPELFAPLTLWQRDFAFKPESGGLMRLLASHQQQKVPVKGLERTILHSLGLNVQSQLPWARLRHSFESDDMYQPPLLCADPVYMQTGSDAVLLHADTPALTRDETELLFLALNQHLEQDGLILKAFHPQRWYLYALDERFSKTLPTTTPLSEVGGENIFPFLPQSVDKYFRQLLNEIQMLLHNHEVNETREARGQLPVNGVWFWGEGEVGIARFKGITAVQGGGHCGEVIAAACAVKWQKRPVLELTDLEGEVLVILDQLQAAALVDRPEVWQENLKGLSEYFAYLMEVLQAGGEVTLYDVAGNAWQCENIPGWQFWRSKMAEWEQFI